LTDHGGKGNGMVMDQNIDFWILLTSCVAGYLIAVLVTEREIIVPDLTRDRQPKRRGGGQRIIQFLPTLTFAGLSF
jgi:hypothetical protein